MFLASLADTEDYLLLTFTQIFCHRTSLLS